MGDKHRLLHYLHSLDDKSLKSISQGSVVKQIISDNIALSHRCASILAANVESPPRVRKAHPIHFSLSPVKQIQITGDTELDTNTLLETPQEQIDEVLDSNKYEQDDVVMEIRSIVNSPSYKARRSTIEHFGVQHSPYKAKR